MACDSSRFDAIIEKKVPLVLSVGAVDMVNFGARDTIPSIFQQRKILEHNKQVMRLESFFPFISIWHHVILFIVFFLLVLMP